MARRARQPASRSPSAPSSDLIEAWFASRGWTPWQFQRETWGAYAAGCNGLVVVPTGAGKTYAAFMGPLRELAAERFPISAPESASTLRVIYVTPLRAVSRDVEKALRRPIEDLELPFLVESRTGDTSAGARARQRTRLPHVLITTPESLSLLLAAPDAQPRFSGVRCVIVDEWHELLPTKRGTQVELALTRLRSWAPELRTWGLSATLPNPDRALELLAGMNASREGRIISAPMDRPVEIDALLPSRPTALPWAGHLGLSMLPDVACAIDPQVSTLVFTNTRSQAERWFHALLVARPELAPIMALHHGSLDRADREAIEAGIKSGQLRLVVATSSLDLGVDFEPVERVFQIGSPKGVARLVQRAGRAAHRPHAACRVTCVPTHALELVEIVAAREAWERREIEGREAPSKPLDVLVQHLVSCGLGGGFVPDLLFAEVRSATSFRDLSREEFNWALALAEHGGATLSAYPEQHRLTRDGDRCVISTPRAAQLHRLNIGTIVADASLEIRYLSGKSLGRIDEGFVAHLRPGERFVFAGKVLAFVSLRDLVVYVKPAPGSTMHTPLWAGTRLPISESLSRAMRHALGRLGRGDRSTPEFAAAASLARVQQHESLIPSPEETLVELTSTREGQHLFIFPFEGRLVHAGLAALLALRVSRHRPLTLAIAANDYGFELLGPPEVEFEPWLTDELFSTSSLAADVVESLNLSELARLQFREVARVSGLIQQNYPGAAKTGRQVQVSAGLLFDVFSEFEPQNLLLQQARREVLERHFEQSRLARTLARVRNGPRRIVRTKRPTPLSFPLIVERQAAKLSTESIAQRVERMMSQWEQPPSPSTSQASTSP